MIYVIFMFKASLLTVINRLKILICFIRAREKYSYMKLIEIIKVIFSLPYSIRAKKYIEKIEATGEYFVVFLKDNYSLPVFWPKCFPMHDLYQIIVELKDKNHWHYYEIPETNVEPGDIVLDCGASEGLFSITVLERAKVIYLVEASPVFQSSMRKTFSGIDKCKIIPSAVGSKNGEIYFSNNSISSGVNYNYGLKVKLQTVDDLFYRRGIKIDYIKADLEGYEMNMLKGSKDTIRKYKPKIALTTYHDEDNVDEIRSFILSLLPQYKYKVKGIHEQNGNPMMIHFWID